MAPIFWDAYACNARGGWWGCSFCRNGWFCAHAEDRRREAARAFTRQLRVQPGGPPDGWWSEFDRIPGWSIVLKPDTWVRAARRVIHQMISAAARRQRKRRAFVQSIRAM